MDSTLFLRKPWLLLSQLLHKLQWLERLEDDLSPSDLEEQPENLGKLFDW